MTWYAIFDAQGRNISNGEVIDPDHLTAQGFTWLSFDTDPTVSGTKTWSAQASGFTPIPAVPTALSVYQFKSRLTAQERIALRAAAQSDPVVADFMDMLDSAGISNQPIVPAEATIQGALAYCVSKNYLTSDRAAIIGAS